MSHPVLSSDKLAVVTGGAQGIGLASCLKFAELGLRVCIVDLPSDSLRRAETIVGERSSSQNKVFALPVDLGDDQQVQDLVHQVSDLMGAPDLLMNNAVTRMGKGFAADVSEWKQALDINLWGVIQTIASFLPLMKAQESESCIVNVGSKQGITNPPGHPVYNMAKAALKSYTESLEHHLRNDAAANITSHLLIPGWTSADKATQEKGAWKPSQVVDKMLEGIERNDFYILCPDNETTLEMDAKRIYWAASDIVENRPPLSRWLSKYDEEYDQYIKE
jgi:NAD(P)-dependent dehydrogenase (short-subunit alcohol dehydrogenase family)